MNVEEAVGMELSACRRKKRISQERLGFDAGVHRTYVSLIERGIKSPTIGVLFRLCRGDWMRCQFSRPSPNARLIRYESGDSMVTECRGRRPA